MDEETEKERRKFGGESVEYVTDLARRYGAIGPSDALLKAIEDVGTQYQVTLPKPPAYVVPDLRPISLENANAHASARELLQRLNHYYTEWAAKIDSEHQVAIYVVLANGAVIRANQLIEEGFNGVAVEGELNGMPCLLLLQQSSLQFLCVAEKIEPDQVERRKIGFIFSEGNDSQTNKTGPTS